jgi:two-component system, cell cycle sensor histidine kinase and response regulator CckA
MTPDPRAPASGSAAAALAAVAGGGWQLEALAALSDGLVMIGGDLRVTHLCERAQALLGDAEAVTGRGAGDLFPDGEGGRFWEAALAGNAATRLEVADQPRPGGTLELHVCPLPAGLAVYLRDLTGRRSLADSLRTSEESFSFLALATDEPLWDWNLSSGVLTWSSGLARAFDIPAEELKPTLAWWEGRLHPDDRERVLTTLDEAIEGGALAWTEEYRFRRGDESYATVVDRGFVIRGADGRPLRMIGTMMDITRRLRTEEALRRSEERYRRFFDEDLTADYVTTPDGEILDCNPAFARIFGFETVDQARRAHVASLYPRPELREEVLALLREEGAVEGRELELRRRDGVPIHVIANIRGEFDAAGRLLETRGYFFDITAHKRVEEQLRQSQKMEAVGKLAGGVAHDFNNLLTAIQGHAELLLMDHASDTQVHEEAQQIRAAARRAATLTRQLLAFSRRQLLRPRLFELDGEMIEMTRALGHLLGAGVEVEIQLDAPGAHVLADPGQIEQVVLNLVLNARDAIQERGKVRIETGVRVSAPYEQGWNGPPVPHGSYVILAVSDDGTGMDGEVRERIFEPFFTTKDQGSGSGLGLSTVYGIVRQSGGWIQVHTQPGEGSRFEIYLPRAAAPGQGKAEEDRRNRRGSTVLLVEDEPSVRTLARKILEREGYRVVEAGDGEEALRKLEEQPETTDLVLTDVVMPRMSGIELAERLGEARPELPVIFMSGYSDRPLEGRGGLRGPMVLVEKPFSSQTLLRSVQRALA